MSRKNITLLAASHLLVMVAAVILARTTSSISGTARSSVASKTSGTSLASSAPERGSRAASSFRPAPSWKGSEFAKAWKAVRTAKLTTKERLKTQRELLKQWAMVDLTAAIEAALGEEWDGDSSMFFDPDGPFLDVFGDAFVENPEESWEIIRSTRFGVATGMLRTVWIGSVGWKKPLALAERFGELSWRDRQEAIAASSNGAWEPGTTAEIRTQIFNALKQQPPDVIRDEDLIPFVPESTGDSDIAALKARISDLAGEDARMARVMALAFGARLAVKGDADIVAQLEDLPTEFKAAAAWGAFDNPNNKQSLETASILVECEAWDRLEDSNTVFQMQRLCRTGDSEQVAEWATEMPFRKETSELFHRCVETYLRDNMETSREWIAGIEDPDWRDRAYAEYSQQALNAKGDPDSSRWALNQIRDPRFKTMAEGWRADWERRNPGKSK